MEVLQAYCHRDVLMTAFMFQPVCPGDEELFHLAVLSECFRIGCSGSEHPLCSSSEGAAVHARRSARVCIAFMLGDIQS